MKSVSNAIASASLLLLLAGGGVSMPAQAALIDHGTYISDTSSGLDWLDLSTTAGQSVAQALTANSGWSYANNTQVSGLLASFGITYAFTANTFIELAVTNTQASDFISLFGLTTPGASLGGYMNNTVAHSTYLCISTGGCSPLNFTNDSDLSAGNIQVGQFLVRSTNNVPEPGSLLLAGLALAGLGYSRRKTA